MRTMTAAAGSAAFLVIAPGVSGRAGSLVADRMAGRRRLSGAGADHRRGGDRCGPRCAPGRVRQFAIQGRGTPAPPAPPGQLVGRRLYRYVRNPVYLAVLAVTTGQALLLNHPVLLGYCDRLASLFTHDGTVRIPHINAEATGREELRAGIEQLQGLLDYFVQTTHPGAIQLGGDTASGRAYLCEPGRFRDRSSQLNYANYHDRYQRTGDGWMVNQRVYEVRYLDTTPLAGSAPLHKGLDTTGGHHAHHRSSHRSPRLPGPGA